MFTGTTSHSGALVTTIVVLTGTAILRGGAAAADSNQDDQFLALLDKKGIPALENVPSLIDTAHNVCRELDAGMPADGLVNAMVNRAYDIDSTERLYPPGRLARTEARFITAAVEAYCPYDQSKIASIMANPALSSNESTHRGAAYMHNAVNSGSDLREPPPALDMINMSAAWQQPAGIGAVRLPHLMDGGVFASGRYGGNRSDCDAHGPALASLIGAVPSGEFTQPNPPQIPPPAAQIQTPHRPMAPPPPPKQPPPPPKQPPPPPQQVEPPAVGPQPGGAAGSGGGGSTGGNGGGSTGGNGGGAPAEPSPAPSMPPGFVRLAP
jgi:uncharacterized membrane protein YgcG